MVSPAEVSVPVEANPQSEGKNKRLKSIADYAISYGLNEKHADEFLIYLEKVLSVDPHKRFLSKKSIRAGVREFRKHFIGTYTNLGDFGERFLIREGVLDIIPDEFLPYVNFKRWTEKAITNKDIDVTYFTKFDTVKSTVLFYTNENRPDAKSKDFSTISDLVEVNSRREKSRNVDEFFNKYSHGKNREREDENKSISEIYDHLDIAWKLIAPFETFTEEFYGIITKNLDEDTLESVFEEFKTSFIGEYKSQEYFGRFFLRLSIRRIPEHAESIIDNTDFAAWEASPAVKSWGRYHYIPIPTNDGVYVFSKEVLV